MDANERSEFIEATGKAIIMYRPKEASDHEVVEAVIVTLQYVTNALVVASAIDSFAPKSSKQ